MDVIVPPLMYLFFFFSCLDEYNWVIIITLHNRIFQIFLKISWRNKKYFQLKSGEIENPEKEQLDKVNICDQLFKIGLSRVMKKLTFIKSQLNNIRHVYIYI